MATYTYQCDTCLREEDVQHSVHVNMTGQKCWFCGDGKISRVLTSAPPFKLNGGGWASSNYSRDNVKARKPSKA